MRDIAARARVSRRRRTFLKESVILFGFLNGLFLALGVNPGATLLEVARSVAENLVGSSGALALAFTLLPLLLVGAALYFIYRRGGWLGFVAVALAFFAGLALLASPVLGAALLVGALLLGIVATR